MWRSMLLTFLAACTAQEQATFSVSERVVPHVTSVAGRLPGEPDRPVGTVLNEDGTRADFVQNEILLVAPSVADVQPLLDRYDGQIVGRRDLPSSGQVSLLIRVDLSRVGTGRLAADLRRTNPDETREFWADSDDSLRLLALVAREAETWGASISPHWIPEADAIADGWTEEAPTGPSNYDDDAFRWPYMDAGSAQDMDVGGAWQLLDEAGLLNERVSIMVADDGFMPNPDFPTTRSIYGRTFGEEGSLTCGGNPCPWHGTQVTMAAMARVDNGFGTAGPAGPVGELIAVRAAGGIWGLADRMADAIEQEKPDIVVMSLGYTTPITWVPFGPGFLPALDPQVAHFVEFAQQGIAMFAAAGNSGIDVHADDQTARRLPCQLSMVVCVGGMEWDSTVRAGNSNYSTLSGPESVELYGPYRVWSLVDEDDPTNNSIRRISGTSFSAPHVAGIAALMKAADPSLTPDDLRAILRDTAHDGGLGSEVTGPQKRVDAFGAVAAALQLPSVEILEPGDGYSVRVGTEILFEAEASTPGGEPVSLTWTLDDETRVTSEGLGGRHILFYDDLPPGTHTVVARAEAPSGVGVEDTLEVEIEYDPADVFIVNPPHNSLRFAGDAISLVGHTSDVCCLLGDDDVSWRVIRDGQTVFTASGHTTELPGDVLLPGNYEIRFEGTDGISIVGRDIDLRVAEKPAGYPTATITLPSAGSSWIAPELIEFQGYAWDPDDGVVTSDRFRWTAVWTGGTVNLCTGSAFPGGSGTCGFFEAELRDLAGGGTTYTIRMEAMDDDGNIDIDEVGVTLQFAPVP